MAGSSGPAIFVFGVVKKIPANSERHSRESGNLLPVNMERLWKQKATNKPGGVLYIGVTANLVRRVSQHRAGETESFTRKYWLKQLVHFERYEDIRDAIAREKAIKKWLRAWKEALIIKHNPGWDDLYETIL
jgi:putative endonuclease